MVPTPMSTVAFEYYLMRPSPLWYSEAAATNLECRHTPSIFPLRCVLAFAGAWSAPVHCFPCPKSAGNRPRSFPLLRAPCKQFMRAVLCSMLGIYYQERQHFLSAACFVACIWTVGHKSLAAASIGYSSLEAPLHLSYLHRTALEAPMCQVQAACPSRMSASRRLPARPNYRRGVCHVLSRTKSRILSAQPPACRSRAFYQLMLD
ncbi:hypothetical protein V8C44DRAFT_163369 [Trichoderma aethiopicum]